MRISELTDRPRRLALVGLAKNTGKTETLAALLRELAQRKIRVGVTSVGRDGEEHDVIDARIEKPRIRLQAGSLVASTGALLRASGLAHERLAQTGVRTPLGEVVIARLSEQGAVEVAGPSAAEDVHAVSEAMLGFGAEQVLIDGAIDRRAASSPAVSDGLVMATGAVLGKEIEQVVAATIDAVQLVRLPLAASTAADDTPAANTPTANTDAAGAANAGATEAHSPDGTGATIALPRRLVLNGEPAEIAALLAANPQASTFTVEGALSERFLEGLLAARRERAGREVRIVVSDPTSVFISRHGPSWYERQGIAIAVRRAIELRAITVNPVAPQSHRFDSRQLRELIEAGVPDVPVLDVLDPDYRATARS
jgi:hypothetical protein